MPTILQIIPRLDTGGAELSTVEITQALVKAGARALVATEGGHLCEQITEAGGEIIDFPAASKNPLRIIANAAALARLIGARKVDLVHARSRAPAWSALAATRKTGVPFVTTYHGAYGSRGALKTRYNSVMVRGDIVIANSHYTSKLIQDRHGTPENRIKVIHRGVDLSNFDPSKVSEARTEALRSAWELAPDDRVVLQAARLTGWKGQRILIEAAGRLVRAGGLDRTVLILAGDAQGRESYRDGLLARIEALGLSGRVRLVGHCADMAAAFKLAHIGVVPSIEPEAFGRAVTEAAAMECPVICTAIGAPPETVLSQPRVGPDEITGWLVPPNDAAALGDALRHALALDGDAHSQIAHRARRHVAAHYSLNRMQSQTLELYDGLLADNLVERFGAAT